MLFRSGLTDTEHVVRAFGAGGTDYVTKPLRPREVLARIEAHLRNARAQRQAHHGQGNEGARGIEVSQRSSPDPGSRLRSSLMGGR